MSDMDILSQMIKGTVLVQKEEEYGRIAKKKTRITRSADRHDTPDRAMRIDWPGYLQFNQLAGLGA